MFYRSRVYIPSIGINPLMTSCDPILSIASMLETIVYPQDRDKFLEDMAHEIHAFEHKAQLAHYSGNIITSAGYALCCLLDEIISKTSAWGKHNGWLHNNLLSIFYHENYGGEYFFTIIDMALKNPSANLHLLELLYICLSFGFEGKYRNTINGAKCLEEISNNISTVICDHRSSNNQNVFITNDNKNEQNNQCNTKQKQYGIFIITVSVVISAIIYCATYVKLGDISRPVYQLVERV